MPASIRFDDEVATDTDGFGWCVVWNDGTMLDRYFRYRSDACAWCVMHGIEWGVWHGATRMG
jgi:hypothetical protein